MQNKKIDIKQEVYWYTLKPFAESQAHSLDTNISCDVAIIGGGIAGLTVAQQLKAQGMDVVIIEKEFCGGGASGKSSGFITPDSELEFSDLCSQYGDEAAQKLWAFAKGGVSHIKDTIKKYVIECDYQEQDSFFISNDKKGFEIVKEEYKKQSAYYSGSTLYEKKDIPKVLSSDKYSGAIRYSDTFGMISYLYCQGLKEELIKQGVQIFEGTLIEKVKSGKVITKNKNSQYHTITATKIVVTVDHFLPSLKIYPKSVYHAQTFLSISKPLTDEDVKAIFPNDKLMVWDTDLIYQYYRMTGDNRLLFGASSLPYTYLPQLQPDQTHIVNKIESYQKEKFGRTFDIEYIWSGLLGVSKDFLPVVGEHESISGVYYISGCAGLPWAAASALYISDKIISGNTPATTELDQFLKAKRKYPVRDFIQTFITKPIAFALSHGLIKYFK